MKAKRLPSGRYRAQLSAGFDENGKRIRRSFTRDTAWEAEKAALDYKAQNALGIAVYDMTVSAAITKYIQSRSNTASPSTLSTYEHIRDHRLGSIMSKKMTALRLCDVQESVNADAARLSQKSIKSAVGLLSSALSYHGVTLPLKRISYPPKVVRLRELPSVKTLSELISGNEIELACLLAMWLSLRISEVRGLRYSDISSDGSLITVRRSIVYKNGRDTLRDLNKTERSTRTISLPKALYDRIQAQPHSSPEEFIVPLGYNFIYKRYKKLLIAGGYDITFHDLRGLFASTLHTLGIPDKYIQSIGGWANTVTMYNHYIRPLTAEESKYQKIIDDYFEGIVG